MTAGMRSAEWFAGVHHAQTGTAPRRGPTGEQIAAANALYVTRIVSWHRIVPLADGRPSEMCTCGAYAVMCAYLRAAHDILGHPVPWDTADPPPPPYRDA